MTWDIEQKPQVPSRSEIHIGNKVWAVEKINYSTGRLTGGVVKRILTSKPYHPRGIKVMFEDGIVARVQSLTAPTPTPPSNIESVDNTSVLQDDEYSLR